MADIKWSALPASLGLVATDNVPLLAGAVNCVTTLGAIRTFFAQTTLGDPGVDTLFPTEQATRTAIELVQRWCLIPATSYTAAPSTTSVLLMGDTSQVEAGLPVRYVIGGVTYYDLVTAVTLNTSMTIAGAPMGGVLTALEVGTSEMLVQVDFFVSGTYGNGVADLLDADMNTAYSWGHGAAYFVAFSTKHKTDDTGAAQPKVNIKVDGSAVSTADTNKGVLSATTWTANSAVAVNTTNYAVARDDAIEVTCTEAGTNGNAANLTVRCLFVLV